MLDIKGILIKVFTYIRENSGLIWSEYDLQTIISLYLYKIEEKTYYTRNPNFKTNLIHREYPYITIRSQKGDNERVHKFDIVIFSDKDVGNINNKNGYLQVDKEDRYGVKNNKAKRAVYCTHLFELKVKRENLKEEIDHDFNLLREGYNYYEINPELYSILYLYWRPKSNKKCFELPQKLQQLFEKSQEDPKISFYTLIGPKEIWSQSIISQSNLSQYVNSKKIFILL